MKYLHLNFIYLQDIQSDSLYSDAALQEIYSVLAYLRIVVQYILMQY